MQHLTSGVAFFHTFPGSECLTNVMQYLLHFWFILSRHPQAIFKHQGYFGAKKFPFKSRLIASSQHTGYIFTPEFEKKISKISDTMK